MKSDTTAIFRVLWILTVSAIAILSMAELTYQVSGLNEAANISAIAFCLLSVLFVRSFKLREWTLLTMGISVTAVFLQLDGSMEVVSDALHTAAFFGVFIYLVTLLKEAAVRSNSILEVGKYLTNQREGRRYWSTTLGGHFFGVLLNFAAISLLAPLIQSGAKSQAGSNGEHTQLSRLLEQRQVSALIRGFSWIVIWSPTALTQTVVLSGFPEANYYQVVGIGLLASAVLISVGRLEDMLRWKGKVPPLDAKAMPFPKIAAIKLSIVFSVLIVSVLTLSLLLAKSVAVCLMIMAPILTTAWVSAQIVQKFSQQRAGVLIQTLREVVSSSIQNQTRSIYVLGMSAFIGIMAGEIAPVDIIASTIHLDRLPPWVFLACIPLIITMGGQLALSPIMMCVFLSSVISGLNFIPAEPIMIVFALAAGWALSMSASPNATASLLVSSITGIAPTVLTWRWNGLYAAMCFVALCALFWIFS